MRDVTNLQYEKIDTKAVSTSPKMPEGDINVAEPHTRKLVTVRQVSRLETYAGHQLAHIDGWTVVVTGRGFKVGDLAVYMEIDSFLPQKDGRYWEYMAKGLVYLNQKPGYRIRSFRVGRKISQGVAFPLADYPEVTEKLRSLIDKVGREQAERDIMDYSFDDILGIEKWVTEMDYRSNANLGKPPAFVKQPVWQRAQNIKDLFNRPTVTYQITEKLDGLSMSVYHIRRGSR